MIDSDSGSDLTERFEILGIKECTRCGETGDESEEYGVRGIARIRGNLCLECVRELSSDSDRSGGGVDQ